MYELLRISKQSGSLEDNSKYKAYLNKLTSLKKIALTNTGKMNLNCMDRTRQKYGNLLTKLPISKGNLPHPSKALLILMVKN